MRLTILTQNYLPEPDPKMHVLAKGLVSRGHQVKVITGFPNYPQGRIYPGYRQKLWLKEVMDEVEVVRLPLYPDHSRSAVKRSAHYMSFALSAAILGPFFAMPADVVFVYHPPSTLAIPALVMKVLGRAPLVYEIQDMWPETLAATGITRSSLVTKGVDWLCRLAYRQSTAITIISPGFKRNLMAKGVPSEKIHVMMNWGYEGEFELASPDKELARELRMEGRFNVVYAGNMGPAQGLGNVLDAAALLSDLPDVQFVLLGDGVELPELQEKAKTLRLSNMRFIPRLPMEKMPSIYPLAQVMLIHLTNDPLFEITIPGKTQSYLASGRPLLVSVKGDAADLVLEAGAGIASQPSNPESLADAVRQLYNMPESRREAMGSAGREFYESNLTPEVLISRYEELFCNLMK